MASKHKNKFNQKFQNTNFENYKTVLKRTLKMGKHLMFTDLEN